MTDCDRAVVYLRVSTSRQGESRLGLEAQRTSVTQFLRGQPMQILGEFVEIESAKGSDALHRRPQLRAALNLCRRRKAVLLIAKLDRLARNTRFVATLLEDQTRFIACDMPSASKVMIQMHAVMSEWERDAISLRTREALAAAKARGVRLGLSGPANLERATERLVADADAFAHRLHGVIESLCARGLSMRAIARELNALGVRSPRGAEWRIATVQRVMKRLAVSRSASHD